MKKILLALVLATSIPAFAQHNGHGHNHGRGQDHGRGHDHGGWGWAGPAIITGIIGYEIARNQQQVYAQPPVYVQSVPVYTHPQVQYQSCTPWTETMNQNGSVTRTRTCNQ